MGQNGFICGHVLPPAILSAFGLNCSPLLAWRLLFGDRSEDVAVLKDLERVWRRRRWRREDNIVGRIPGGEKEEEGGVGSGRVKEMKGVGCFLA